MEEPDPMRIEPPLPYLDAPVLTTIIPLTPRTPESAVLNSSAPEVPGDDWPLIIDTRPPVDHAVHSFEADPADRTSSPPIPLCPNPTDT